MKQRKDNFKSMLKGFGLFMLCLVGVGISFSALCPQSTAEVLTSIGIGAGIPTVSVLGAGMMGSLKIHLDPNPSGGGGVETPEEKAKKALFESLKTATQSQLDDFLKTNADLIKIKEAGSKLEELRTQISGAIKQETIDTLKDELNKTMLEVKALKENVKVGNDRGVRKGSIAETLAVNKEKIEGFLNKKSGMLELEHKATETSTDINGRDAYFQWHEGGAVGQIPVRKPFVRELFKQVGSTSEYIKYIDQATVVRDAKNVSLCGSTTHNTKATWTVQSLQIQKVRDFGHVCLDMMQDYPFVDGEIRNLFESSLKLKIDNNFLLSDGVAPNPASIESVASIFAAFNADATANYANAVTVPANMGNANLIDLIGIAGAQIKAFGQNNAWMPNYVLLNPRDLYSLFLYKDSMNNYVKNNQLFQTLFTANGVGRYFINGMELIENPLVPQNEFYIGDFRKGTVYSRPGLGIEFSFENRENFEQELVTVKVYERLNLLIRNVDADAFMHCGDIEQGLFDITAPT